MQLHAIELEGFLRYRDPVVYPLADSRLWLLSGANGVGKSSVFDGITFALYGQHRHGADRIGQLINRQSEGARVAVQFSLDDGVVYRASRHIRRTGSGAKAGAATEGLIEKRLPSGAWSPLKDTRKIKGFNLWIAEHVRLSYEAFVTCVLLRQREAGRLMEIGPTERQRVLSSLCNFEPFRLVEGRLVERRKEAVARAQVLQAQLAGLPVVGVAQEQAAVSEAEATAAAFEQAQRDAELCTRRAEDVARRAQLESALLASEEAMVRAQGLLAARDDVQQALERVEEVSTALPFLEQALRGANEVAEATAAADRHRRVREELLTQFHEHETTLTGAREALVVIEEGERDVQRRLLLLSETQRAHERVGRDLEQCRVQLTQRQALESERQTLATVAAGVGAAEAAERRVDVLRRVERGLEALPGLHARVTATTVAATETAAAVAIAEAALGDGEARALRAREAREVLLQRGAALAQERAVLDATLTNIDEVLVRRQAAAGATECPTCASPLGDEAHTRLHQETEALIGRRDAGRTRRVDLAEEEAGQRAALAQSETTRAALERTVVECRAALERQRGVARDAAHAVETATLAWRAGEEAVRDAAGLAVGVPLPSPEDVATERGQVTAIAQGLAEAQRAQARITVIDGLLGTLPEGRVADVEQQCRAHETTQAATRAEVQACTVQQGRLAAERMEAQRTVQRLQTQQAEIRERGGQARAALDAAEAAVKQAGQRVASARAQLTPLWLEWLERGDLDGVALMAREAQQLPVLRAQAAAAARAAGEIERLVGERSATESALASIPTWEGMALDLAQERLQAARVEVTRAGQAATLARDLVVRVRLAIEQTTTVRKALVEADTEAALYNTLVAKVGRELRARLIQEIQVAIIAQSNQVLSRLSGGGLALTLEPGRGADELEILCIDYETGEEPLAYPFLSVGQQFRVAVALAIGMGQALMQRSGAAKLDTLILDEGFGSLDKMGIEDMLDELNGLTEVIGCVLVVSHLEKVQKAFAHEYRVALADRTAVVGRYHYGEFVEMLADESAAAA